MFAGPVRSSLRTRSRLSPGRVSRGRLTEPANSQLRRPTPIGRMAPSAELFPWVRSEVSPRRCWYQRREQRQTCARRVYRCRAEIILKRRRAIKAKTVEKRRLLNCQTAKFTQKPTSQTLRSRSGPRVPNQLTTDTLVANQHQNITEGSHVARAGTAQTSAIPIA